MRCSYIPLLAISLAVPGNAAVPLPLLFNYQPKAQDISPDGKGVYKLYSGQWYAKRRAAKGAFRDFKDGLAIPLRGEIATASNSSEPGALPLIDSSRSFSVTFTARITGTDRDNWPALWLMPVEHDAKQRDRDPSAPDGHEKWTEIDIDEGGFGPGLHGNALAWSGKWPDYSHTASGPMTSGLALDRTKFHRFSYVYDAKAHQSWWALDDVRTKAFTAPPFPGGQRYYLIASANNHGQNKPYWLIVKSIEVRGFAAPN